MQNGGLDKESEDAICSGETGASRHANWTVKENLEAGLKWKEEGNRHMQGKDHASALKCYHKANLHLAGIID